MAPNTLFGVPEMQDTPPCRLSAVYKPSDFSGGFFVHLNDITLVTVLDFDKLNNTIDLFYPFKTLPFCLSSESNAVVAWKQPVPNQ